ncbi:amidase [Cohnella suwonensis]|uniref:Amidase n=1 Tax=Cohnella suwonensis TaxID=696072 RepID=A0ABW0LQM0_9BACL
MSEHWNAFIREDVSVDPSGEGDLDGLTFAVKDVFEIRGHANAAGNPDWFRTHGAAIRNAPAVDNVLKKGARLKGVTHTDEMMFSLNGENLHYGTPVNPRAPGRIPGGSSSGSAVAAAAGLVDFALGTDTGGSVRVPSSYCGVYGFRPTHGIVPIEGVIPLAPSFDTVGWMALDAKVMRDVGRALLPEFREGQTAPFTRFFFAREAWELIDEACREALSKAVSGIAVEGGHSEWISLSPEGLPAWFGTFRTIQGYEIWQTHGEWIEREHPVFGPDIAQRFAWTRTLQREDYERENAARQKIRTKVEELLGSGGLLVIPTAPYGAPRIGLAGEESDRIRTKVMQLSCLAGLTGLPQVTIPVAGEKGIPFGLSLIAGSGQDIRLLEWVYRKTANVSAKQKAAAQL